jgi:hypothetical protein
MEKPLRCRMPTGQLIELRPDGTWAYVDGGPPSSPVASGPSTDELPDFRNVRWGMSRQEVRESEDLQPLEESPDHLAYTTEVACLEAILVYSFVQAKLAAAMYIFSGQHANNNEYIADYERLKAHLEQKYGTPSESGVNWKNRSYKDDPENWGLALAAGQVAFISGWALPGTAISFLLGGDNFQVHMSISYKSVKLASLAETAKDIQVRRNL